MLQSMQIGTGINVNALLELRQQVAHWLNGETLHGTLWMAGLPKTMMADAAA
jgi:hydroxymethylglutaryl-CoA lyase